MHSSRSRALSLVTIMSISAAQYLVQKLRASWDKEERDYKLTCQGEVFMVHSFILSTRSEFFKTALETDVGEKKMELNINSVVLECSPEVLACVVDFMYGIDLPAGFHHSQCLFKIADIFLMDDLKAVASSLLSQSLNMSNVQDVAKLAQIYREPKLLEQCHDLVLLHVDVLDKEELEEFALTVPSIAMKALQSVRNLKRKLSVKDKFENTIFGTTVGNAQYKTVGDFGSLREYKNYVMTNIKKDMLVRSKRSIYTGKRLLREKGDIGRVINIYEGIIVEVRWEKSRDTSTLDVEDCYAMLDLVTLPIQSSFLEASAEKNKWNM